MSAVREEALGVAAGADSGELDLILGHARFDEGLSIHGPKVEVRLLSAIPGKRPRTIRKDAHDVISNGVAAGPDSGTNPRQ